MKFTHFLYLFPVLFFACEPTPKNEQPIAPPAIEHVVDTIAPKPKAVATYPKYDLSKPAQTSRLSKKLVEISALSLSPNGQELVTVNDEQGKIFYMNKEDGNITKTVKFGKGGDYEGIETVGKDIYVVESNGTLHKVSKLDKDKPHEKIYNTKLNSKYNVEGLGLDQANNRLLLACKGKAGDGDKMKGSRAIYAFDLNEHELLDDPVYLINRKAVGNYFQADNISQKLVDLLSGEYGSNRFAPSGIAIHPETSDICILSSVGKLFIILSPTGKILHMEKLESAIFKQPEGICFDKNGTLYISTEGKGGKAKLYKFLQL